MSILNTHDICYTISMKTIEVVGMAIIDDSNRVLIAQRPQNKSLANKWEFPGGKLEEGETLEKCIVREIKEELNLDVLPIQYIGQESFDYEHASVTLHLFIGRIISDSKVVLHEHQKVKWTDISKLARYDFPEVDLPFIPRLERSVTKHI